MCQVVLCSHEVLVTVMVVVVSVTDGDGDDNVAMALYEDCDGVHSDVLLVLFVCLFLLGACDVIPFICVQW